jgi:hypothetical protein
VDVGLAEKTYTEEEIAVMLDEEITKQRDEEAMSDPNNWWCGSSYSNMLETCTKRCTTDVDCKPSSWEEGFWPLLSCISRAIAWLAWAFAEEWVFRKVLLEKLRTRYSAWISILIVTALWTLTRSWHQGLGLNQTITLILLGMALGLSVCQGRSYLTGAAILGTSTLIFQVLFSLPVLGQDFTGIWIIKFRAENLLQLVSGGPGGPLSSAFLQLALASWIAFNWKIVWTPKSPQLR